MTLPKLNTNTAIFLPLKSPEPELRLSEKYVVNQVNLQKLKTAPLLVATFYASFLVAQSLRIMFGSIYTFWNGGKLYLQVCNLSEDIGRKIAEYNKYQSLNPTKYTSNAPYYTAEIYNELKVLHLNAKDLEASSFRQNTTELVQEFKSLEKKFDDLLPSSKDMQKPSTILPSQYVPPKEKDIKDLNNNDKNSWTKGPVKFFSSVAAGAMAAIENLREKAWKKKILTEEQQKQEAALLNLQIEKLQSQTTDTILKWKQIKLKQYGSQSPDKTKRYKEEASDLLKKYEKSIDQLDNLEIPAHSSLQEKTLNARREIVELEDKTKDSLQITLARNIKNKLFQSINNRTQATIKGSTTTNEEDRKNLKTEADNCKKECQKLFKRLDNMMESCSDQEVVAQIRLLKNEVIDHRNKALETKNYAETSLSYTKKAFQQRQEDAKKGILNPSYTNMSGNRAIKKIDYTIKYLKKSQDENASQSYNPNKDTSSNKWDQSFTMSGLQTIKEEKKIRLSDIRNKHNVKKIQSFKFVIPEELRLNKNGGKPEPTKNKQETSKQEESQQETSEGFLDTLKELAGQGWQVPD